MPKIRKCLLNWKPSESDQFLTYRLYWSKGDTVNYDSNFFEVGNVTEVYLPGLLKLDPRYDLRLMLGVTAVDMNGNESDMAVLPEPYHTKTPPPPAELLLTRLDEPGVRETTPDESPDQMEMRPEKDAQQDELEKLARTAKPPSRS